MKKVISVLGVLLLVTFLLPVKAFATSSNVYVNLNSLEYSVDKQNYTSVPEYATLADFLVDYSANNLSSIYITDFLFDGVSSVKTPDLDDFIENGSNDTKIKTLDIKVININTTGNIEFTGEITGAMIGVNTNNVELEVDGVFVNIGYEPSIGILKSLNLEMDKNYIIVDKNMETSVKGVYACGDIIKKDLYQLVTAVSEGAIAATSVYNNLKYKK